MDELDDFIAAWDEVDREAVESLCAALDAHRDLPPPAVELAAAAARVREEIDADLFPLGWVHSAAALERGALPDDDAELMLRCAAATISPREETGLGIEEEAALPSLEHADWLAAAIVTVREGGGLRGVRGGAGECRQPLPGDSAGGRPRHRRGASPRGRVLDCRAGLARPRPDRPRRAPGPTWRVGPAASARTGMGRRVRFADDGVNERREDSWASRAPQALRGRDPRALFGAPGPASSGHRAPTQRPGEEHCAGIAE